jgi:hypothetical protein
MDDRTGKHSANGLRTNAQRTTANIPIGGIEELLLSGVFIFFSFCHQRVRKTDLKIILPSPSLWLMIFILCKYTPKVLILSNYVLNIFKTH